MPWCLFRGKSPKAVDSLLKSNRRLTALQLYSRIVVERLRACQRTAPGQEKAQAEEENYLPGGSPLVEPPPEEPPPPSGEPNWNRSIVSVRNPRPAKTSASAILPK